MTETVKFKGKEYNKERLCLVFDSETMSHPLNQIIFDYGWSIIDLDSGETLKKVEYIDEYLYEEALVKEKGFLIKDGTVKSGKYFYMCSRGLIKILPAQRIFAQLKKDLKKVQFMSAYNISFDSGALNKTHFYYYEKEFLELEEVQLVDIYNLSANLLLNNRSYKWFATHNEDGSNKFITEKGNYKTSAESTYAYIKRNPEHIEQHTALQDVLEEAEILLHILKNCSDIQEEHWQPNAQAWRIVNKK